MTLDRILFLTGYRGTGKTTVAKELGERLGCETADSDDVLQIRAGRSVAEIFSQDGEQTFRDLEQQVVADLASGDPCVVSLGGGAVLREANQQAIAGHYVVWLKASPQVLADRLASDQVSSTQRPSLTGQGLIEEIEQVLAKRTPTYQQCATIVVDTDNLPPDEVADEILRQLALPSE